MRNRDGEFGIHEGIMLYYSEYKRKSLDISRNESGGLQTVSGCYNRVPMEYFGIDAEAMALWHRRST